MASAAVTAGQARPIVRSSRPRKQLATVTEPRLSVIIVNYIQWEATRRVVQQVTRSAPCKAGEVEVVVVDNHSQPHPVAASLRRRRGVSLRRWGRNRGFARAVNEGSRLSRGEWLLLLNPDVTLPRGFLKGALDLSERLAAEEPQAGIVGFHLRNPDGSMQLSSGPFPTLAGTLAGLMLPRARRKYRAIHSRRRCRVPWVTGCCLLVRRNCFRQLGGFDENFFLYYEDVDLCLRARERGWSVWYEPSLHAVHHRPLHSRAVPPHMRVVTRHALLTYGGKHWPEWQFRLLAGMIYAEAWLRGRWASRQGETVSAAHFNELQTIAREMVAGSPAAARRSLARVLRHEERLLAR
jgi:GT2 family glycosyltransferase